MSKPFKIKNPYPINRKGMVNPNSEGNTDLSDGRSGSAAFQYKSPAKQSKGLTAEDRALMKKQNAKKKAACKPPNIFSGGSCYTPAEWEARQKSIKNVEEGKDPVVDVITATGGKK